MYHATDRQRASKLNNPSTGSQQYSVTYLRVWSLKHKKQMNIQIMVTTRALETTKSKRQVNDTKSWYELSRLTNTSSAACSEEEKWYKATVLCKNNMAIEQQIKREKTCEKRVFTSYVLWCNSESIYMLMSKLQTDTNSKRNCWPALMHAYVERNQIKNSCYKKSSRSAVTWVQSIIILKLPSFFLKIFPWEV